MSLVRIDPGGRGWRRLRRLALPAAVLVAAGVPFNTDRVVNGQLTLVLVYAIAALGLNLLVGYAGQISLGHGAFFAIGAYTAAILVARAHLPYPLAVPAAALLAFALGFAFGVPALRLRGLYLALVTLALAIATPPLIKRFEGLTGGVQGMSVPQPAVPGWLPVDPDQFLYLLALVVAVPMFLLAANLTRGGLGRALVAIRENERAATTMGVDRARVKSRVFAWSAAYAGVAGALFALTLGFVAPESFNLALSFIFLAAIVIGGLGTLGGALFGALFIEFVPQYAERVNQALTGMIYGATLIAVIYLMPGGVAGLLRSLRRRLVEVAEPPPPPGAESSEGPHTKEGPMVGGRSKAGRGRFTMLALLALALVAAGCGRDEGGGGGAGAADPGITDTSIKLGGSYPFSGPASAYGTIAKGANAYFKFINDKGGVNGRKIEFVTYDDGYEPQRALTNARKLVEQDKVFAVVNPLGTANNIAMREYLNGKKVPQLFVATGSSLLSGDPKFPYTTGWQPTYKAEAKVYAEYVKQTKPSAKVAVLYQNDSFGKELLDSFTSGISGSQVSIVAKEPYEATAATVAPSVVKLANSGADVFLDISTPKAGAQAIGAVAQSGWKPLHILNSVAASKTQVLKPVGYQYAQGIVTAAYTKTADDPQWTNDAAMKEFLSDLKKYAPDADPNDPYSVYGWSVGYTIVETLKKVSGTPTRDALMQAAKNLDVTPPLLLPGITVKTSDSDPYPIEAMQIAQFTGESFKLQGQVIQADT
ncbi:MAG TPA: ABC transporter substrate-binding protein [Actinomycetota bacterium]